MEIKDSVEYDLVSVTYSMGPYLLIAYLPRTSSHILQSHHFSYIPNIFI